MTWQRALVLGGGGLIGVAWESGLCAGLMEREVDMRECQAFVGTSAGAINCAWLASGRMPPRPDELPKAAKRSTAIDPAALDGKALGEVFTRWSQLGLTTPSEAREIGLIARDLYRDAEPRWVEGIGALLELSAWPDKPFFVNAVDTESGERVTFDATQAVPLARAIAASAAVPAIFASVTINGRRYMDGQIQSSTNADVLLRHPTAEKPREVLIIMPTNSHTAPGIGAHAERAVQAEIAALEAVGCKVRLITPTVEHIARLGTNLMDDNKTLEAYAVGFEAGVALSRELG
jgi:NTE family protein